MLHGLCFGEEAGARNLVFFCVKWLQPAMKGTSCVRRLRLGSFRVQSVPPLCSATSGCSCVRGSMRFLMCVDACGLATSCCKTQCNGCMNVAWALFWGGSRSTKPCIFPCKVASAGDERYLVCAAVAVWIVSSSIGSSSVFCNEWLFLCA